MRNALVLIPGRKLLIAVVLVAGAALSSTAPALAQSGPQYGTIGQYGEVWRGGGFDTCWFDGGNYDGKGCTPSETQPLAGEFVDPVGFAVDTKDPDPSGSSTALYVLDRTSDLPANVTADGGTTTTWRLQKLSSTGAVLGVDQFSLPADTTTIENSGITDYEMFGLTVDPALGRVYALLVAYDQNIFPAPDEIVDEIVSWSTTPNTSKQLVGTSGLPADTVSAGINGYPTPSVLSDSGQLSQLMQSPTGLAIDATGGTDYVAVQGLDPTADNAGAGIVTVSPTTGKVVTKWSSAAFATLPNDSADEEAPPAGLSVDPMNGSLVWLDDEETGAPDGGGPADFDIADLPADLTSTPTILSSEANAVEDNGLDHTNLDDTAVATADLPPESYDDGTPLVATATASPQIVALSNGLYAAAFASEPPGAPDPSNPAGQPGDWTATSPGIRLLEPDASGLLSEVDPPLMTLFDTLGNTTTNDTTAPLVSTTTASACNLSDAVSAAADGYTYPSLAAGSGGAVWVLLKGQDTAVANWPPGWGSPAEPHGAPPPLQAGEGGRELIELAPKAGDSCPVPSGTFSEGAGGTTQPASSPTPLTVGAGTTVSFDASTIQYLGGAPAAYTWSFGDGDTVTTLDGDKSPFTWPSPTATEQYTTPGDYTVTLDLYGDFGEYIETGTVDVVPATPPVASFTFSPPNPQTGQTVTFDGSASTPGNGTIAQYEWSFGDGTTDVTSTPTDTHTYSTSGTYTATLTLRDSDFAVSAPVSVTVPVTLATTTTTTTTTTMTTGTQTPPPIQVSNKFKIVGLSENAKKGTILADLSLPDPGTVKILATFTKTVTVSVKSKHGKKKKSKHEQKTITFASVTRTFSRGAAAATLTPTSAATAALRALSTRSSITVGLRVTFTPTGGTGATRLAGLKVKGLKAAKGKSKKK